MTEQAMKEASQPAVELAPTNGATVKFNRRDMIEIQKLWRNVPFTKLFTDKGPSAEAALGFQYLAERRSGGTDLTFNAWLDEDLEVELTEEPDEDEADPT